MWSQLSTLASSANVMWSEIMCEVVLPLGPSLWYWWYRIHSVTAVKAFHVLFNVNWVYIMFKYFCVCQCTLFVTHFLVFGVVRGCSVTLICLKYTRIRASIGKDFHCRQSAKFNTRCWQTDDNVLRQYVCIATETMQCMWNGDDRWTSVSFH